MLDFKNKTIVYFISMYVFYLLCDKMRYALLFLLIYLKNIIILKLSSTSSPPIPLLLFSICAVVIFLFLFMT